jgi:purine nucleoside permease
VRIQFTPERQVWLEPMQLNIDYPLIGGSPLFPNISCEAKRDVCIVTTGEAEINAAATSTFTLPVCDPGTPARLQERQY